MKRTEGTGRHGCNKETTDKRPLHDSLPLRNEQHGAICGPLARADSPQRSAILCESLRPQKHSGKPRKMVTASRSRAKKPRPAPCFAWRAPLR